MVLDLWRYLTDSSKEEWHTLFAMLPSRIIRKMPPEIHTMESMTFSVL